MAQAVSAAAKLGVADAVGVGASTTEQIAGRTGTHAPTLRRLLRALSDLGVFRETPDGAFALTPVGETLRADDPHSMRRWAILTGSRFHRDAWSDLDRAVTTGASSFARVHNMDLFEHLNAHPDDAAVFDGAMQDIAGNSFLAGILAAYDFSGFADIVDVGGGTGALLATILQSAPRARGTLVDSAHVLAAAEPVLVAAGVADRCLTIAGDFFDQVPAGADLYVLSNIIHDWDDEDAYRILQTCRAAMADGSRLLIIELVLPDDATPSMGKLLDLEMLSVTNGRQRTATEHERLLARAGLAMTNVAPSVPEAPASFVEATLQPQADVL